MFLVLCVCSHGVAKLSGKSLSLPGLDFASVVAEAKAISIREPEMYGVNIREMVDPLSRSFT